MMYIFLMANYCVIVIAIGILHLYGETSLWVCSERCGEGPPATKYWSYVVLSIKDIMQLNLNLTLICTILASLPLIFVCCSCVILQAIEIICQCMTIMRANLVNVMSLIINISYSLIMLLDSNLT